MNLEKWEWAWLAGLFEGEGSITFSNESEKYQSNTVQVKIVMTDKDVIETVDRLIPSPRGIRSYKFPTKKEQWVWMLSSKEVIEPFLVGIIPFLHFRRSARAHAALVRLSHNRGAHSKRTHCPKGHPLADANLYIKKDGARSCLTCRKERDLRRNAEQKEARRLAREQRKLQSSSP